jgi:hypothetical protein
VANDEDNESPEQSPPQSPKLSYPLAFTKAGRRIKDFHADAKFFMVGLHRRGEEAAVQSRQGGPLIVPLSVTLDELRRVVPPGDYKLYQVDGDGDQIDGAPSGFVSVPAEIERKREPDDSSAIVAELRAAVTTLLSENRLMAGELRQTLKELASADGKKTDALAKTIEALVGRVVGKPHIVEKEIGAAAPADDKEPKPDALDKVISMAAPHVGPMLPGIMKYLWKKFAPEGAPQPALPVNGTPTPGADS